MKTLFQKLITLPELFHKEPPKKLVQQKRSAKQKIAFAALTSFTAMGASYLTYRYLSPKINIPNSSVSNTINTALKIVGSITALAGLAGLLTYPTTNQPNTTQKEKSNTKTEDPNHSKKPTTEAVVSEEKTNPISPKNTKSQTILTENKNAKNVSNGENPTHYYIVKLFYEFREKEKINKNLLEKLITTYNDLHRTSPESTNSHKTFIQDCTIIINDYQSIFFTPDSSLDNKKSNLNKIIDILDVITGRTDLLSCRLVNHLFPDIIPNGLHKMTQMIEQEDKECQEIIERSHQLIYKALTQQMKILFKDGIIFKKKLR